MIFGDPAVEARLADVALDTLLTARDHLQKVLEDGGLSGYTNAEQVAFMQTLERGRNKIALLDHVVITDAIVHDLPGELCQSSMTRVLTHALRISAGEASRRVQAAAQVGERVSMTGEPLGPVRPILAAAQRAGEVTPEQVHLIQKALGPVDRPGFDQADITTGEQILTTAALNLDPKEVKVVADRVVEAINPDGTLPRDALNRDRRYFHLRATSDGAYTGEFRLTGSLGAKLEAILGPLTKPRTGTITHPDGTVTPTTTEVDPRTFGQRRQHDGPRPRPRPVSVGRDRVRRFSVGGHGDARLHRHRPEPCAHRAPCRAPHRGPEQPATPQISPTQRSPRQPHRASVVPDP